MPSYLPNPVEPRRVGPTSAPSSDPPNPVRTPGRTEPRRAVTSDRSNPKLSGANRGPTRGPADRRLAEPGPTDRRLAGSGLAPCRRHIRLTPSECRSDVVAATAHRQNLPSTRHPSNLVGGAVGCAVEVRSVRPGRSPGLPRDFLGPGGFSPCVGRRPTDVGSSRHWSCNLSDGVPGTLRPSIGPRNPVGPRPAVHSRVSKLSAGLEPATLSTQVRRPHRSAASPLKISHVSIAPSAPGRLRLGRTRGPTLFCVESARQASCARGGRGADRVGPRVGGGRGDAVRPLVDRPSDPRSLGLRPTLGRPAVSARRGLGDS